jgi:NADH:ubiquinone oxidoreductase subunit 2 (subunit N)
VAKFQVLTGLMLSAADPRLIAIPALALVLALVAAAGYLRVLIAVWSQPGPGTEPTRQPGALLAWSVSLVALVVLVLSVGPQILFRG